MVKIKKKTKKTKHNIDNTKTNNIVLVKTDTVLVGM